MSWEYSCPHCHAMLNPDATVILIAEHDDCRVVVGLHPHPGNYEVYMPRDVVVADGSTWTFSCPSCHHDLRSEATATLCGIDVLIESEQHRVLFSRVAGEKATFVVGKEGLKEQHGPDADRYDWSLPHLKYLL